MIVSSQVHFDDWVKKLFDTIKQIAAVKNNTKKKTNNSCKEYHNKTIAAARNNTKNTIKQIATVKNNSLKHISALKNNIIKHYKINSSCKE